MSADQHTIFVDIYEGSLTFRMNCPYDLDDQTRPCWAVDTENDDRPPLPAPQPCNYADWVENLSPDEIDRSNITIECAMEWEWPGDYPTFKLLGPTPESGETKP